MGDDGLDGPPGPAALSEAHSHEVLGPRGRSLQDIIDDASAAWDKFSNGVTDAVGTIKSYTEIDYTCQPLPPAAPDMETIPILSKFLACHQLHRAAAHKWHSLCMCIVSPATECPISFKAATVTQHATASAKSRCIVSDSLPAWHRAQVLRRLLFNQPASRHSAVPRSPD
jgi:hypothetical protein